MKITAGERRIFESVMSHLGLEAEEIELCKQAYRNDPEAGRITYAALATEIPLPVEALLWVAISQIAKGISKRA